MKGFKQIMLLAPDTQLDSCMKPLIEKWSDPPKAIEILEVLDRCIFSSLCTGFVVTVLEHQYKVALNAEGLTEKEITVQARWRTKL